MRYKTIVNLVYSVHEVLPMSHLHPSYAAAGKGIRYFEGNTVEDCVSQVKNLCKQANILVSQEEKREPLRNPDDYKSRPNTNN